MSETFELTNPNTTRETSRQEARTFPAPVARALAKRAFKPHSLFTSGHAQTIAAYVWPRRVLLATRELDSQRIFEVAPGVRLLAFCRWQPGDARERPTIMLAHGLEGSSDSRYMLGLAHKAFPLGFNIVRLNLRNCGGTEHLTPTLYNSGLSSDLQAVVEELIERDGLGRIFMIGISMSGNMVLKLAGEYADAAPRALAGICAISPSIDLHACAEAINMGSNWIYQESFMRSLRRRIRAKQKLYPELYDIRDLRRVRTIREFDERYTAADGGYANVDDYYERASSLPLIGQIRVPALVIHAQDDPFIPFRSFLGPSLQDNPHLFLLAPEHGGHVGFISAEESQGEDRFWAENRAIEFCSLMNDLTPI